MKARKEIRRIFVFFLLLGLAIAAFGILTAEDCSGGDSAPADNSKDHTTIVITSPTNIKEYPTQKPNNNHIITICLRNCPSPPAT